MIVAIGVLLYLLMGQSERERRSVVAALAIGDPASAADAAIGMRGTPCETGTLEHLRESFPAGWSPAAIDVALEQLAAETAERRVYSIGREAVVCATPTERTEVGVSEEGRILWIVPILGRTALLLPPTVAPAGLSDEAAPAAVPS